MTTNILSDWAIIQAEEGFMYEAQYAIALLMKEKGVSQAGLARALGKTPSYISQMLNDDGRNLTTRTIARIFAILGEEVNVTSTALEAARAKLRDKALQTVPSQQSFCEAAVKEVASIAEARACIARTNNRVQFHREGGDGAPIPEDMLKFADEREM